MDVGAARKGVVKMSKADAKAQARLDFKTDMYMQNVQKVKEWARTLCYFNFELLATQCDVKKMIKLSTSYHRLPKHTNASGTT